MKKRDKLYTVNKWNRNLFNTGGDIAKWDRLASAAYGANYGGPGYTLNTYMNDSGNNWFGISKADNPFSKGNIGNTMRGIGGAAATAAPREAFDYLDPIYHLAGGRETKVGNALSDTGVGLFKAGAQSGNGYMMLAGAAAKIGGGLINAGWGYKKNDKNINNITQNTAIARNAGNMLSSSNDSTTLLNNAGTMTSSLDFGTKDLIKGGWFTKGKARQKGQRYIDAENDAIAYQNHGMTIGADKVDNNIDNTAQSNFIYATGGPLDKLVKPGIKTLIEEAKKTSAERTAPDWINWNLNDIANAIVGKGKKKKGKFSKGEFGGGGAGTKFGESWLPYSEVKRDTIWLPVEETFNDAFARARKAGLKEFDFDGKRYSTEIGDNPNNYSAGQRRTQAIGAIPIPIEYEQDGINRASDMTDEEFNAAMAEREAELKAFGGPLDYLAGGDMGAINYGFMTDYLTTKKKQAEASNKVPGISPMANAFGEGGIEIKHPGRLTRLKERTGKTEAELYNDGNPAHKKMVVFARNSRRWNKKALGGYLKGKVYDVPKEEVDKLIAAGYGVEYL